MIKYILLVFILLLPGCSTCHDSIVMETRLHDEINRYQGMSGKAYSAGEYEKYRYYRGIADGLAISRFIFETKGDLQ